MPSSPARSSTSEDGDGAQQGSPGILHQLVKNHILNPLEAVLDFISSPTFLRLSISTVLLFIVSAILFAVSTTAYLFFYYSYIPPISLSLPLYMQYGTQPYDIPYATADIPQGTLISGQSYAITVDLEIPRTPSNLQAGVFMVDVRLLGAFDPVAEPPKTLRELLGNITSFAGEGHTVLQHSRRPAMLRYRSRLLNFVREVAYLPLHMTGLRDLDTESAKVKLWDAAMFNRGSGNLPRAVRVEVASGGSGSGPGGGAGSSATGLSKLAGMDVTVVGRQIQIYKASITFSARFHGLRYIIYNFRILSFVAFSTTFYLTSIISMGLVWAWIGPSLTAPSPSSSSSSPIKPETTTTTDPQIKIKQEPKSESVKKIKAEDPDDDEDSSLTTTTTATTTRGLKIEDVSDSPAQFPTSRGRPPLRYAGRESQHDENDPVATVMASLEGLTAAGAGGSIVGVGVGAGNEGDDEDDEDDEIYYEDDGVQAQGSSTGRFDHNDSGFGTMSEETHTTRQKGSGSGGLVRRRSGRGAP